MCRRPGGYPVRAGPTGVNHPQAVYEINTGSILMGKPSLGSWVSNGGAGRGIWSAFLVLPDPAGGIKGGPPAYGAGFLPATTREP